MKSRRSASSLSGNESSSTEVGTNDVLPMTSSATTTEAVPNRKFSWRLFTLFIVVNSSMWVVRLDAYWSGRSLQLRLKSKAPLSPRLAAPPQPVFQTESTDLLKTIDLCFNLRNISKQGWCHVVHLYPDVDNGNRTRVVLDAGSQTAQRLEYLVAHLETLTVPGNMTMAIFTADAVSPEFTGLPLVTHTTDDHAHHLLLPTPYLMRDMHNGHLEEVLKLKCNVNDNTPSSEEDQQESFRRRKNSVYFRGKYRNEFRLKVGRFSARYNKERRQIVNNGSDSNNNTTTLESMDVRFVDLPASETEMQAVKKSSWMLKEDYKYLLTLPGGHVGESSQWEVYHDVLSGGVIVRYANDKFDHWTYNIMKMTETAAPLVVTFETPDEIPQLLSDPYVQEYQYRMAALTQQYACEHLQPAQIRRYSQTFLNEYFERYGSIVSSVGDKTYELPYGGGQWTPKAVALEQKVESIAER